MTPPKLKIMGRLSRMPWIPSVRSFLVSHLFIFNRSNGRRMPDINWAGTYRDVTRVVHAAAGGKWFLHVKVAPSIPCAPPPTLAITLASLFSNTKSRWSIQFKLLNKIS